MKKLIFFFLLYTLILQVACVPFVEEQLTEVTIDYRDSTFQEIITWQDQQLVDSLYQYFDHKDPSFRYLAAIAFGSIKAPEAIDSLTALLADPIDEVRAAAAFALGQIGESSAEEKLINAFDKQDSLRQYLKAHRAILEAVGRCGSEKYLAALSSVNYQSKDTSILEGQAWGIYRYALRGITSPSGTQKMVTLSKSDLPVSVRFIAANYLYRAAGINLENFASELIDAYTAAADPRIRMALAIGLGKTKNPIAQNTLLTAFASEQDYRVKCNILSALGNFEYGNVQETVLEALNDPNIHIADRAAEFFLNFGIPEDARLYWNLAKEERPWQIQLKLYRAANRFLPAYYSDYRDAINSELRRKFRTSIIPYEKAAALKAIGEYGWNLRFIQREGFKAEHPAIRVASLESLEQISNIPTFEKYFGISNRRITRELTASFKLAIQSGDAGMIAVAAKALRTPERNFARYLDSLEVLDQALKALKLPQEIETYNELKKTIDFLKGNPEGSPHKPAYNHPINWKVLNTHRKNAKANIVTKYGNIELELMPNNAPGTVANFLTLTAQGFYNGKNFHRVVSNFVIQGGCPRGDGYGSLDYSIRSELSPLHYNKEGFVGMASAGNHTEGTQFFITHSPTPHLDGNYTIFAKVTAGIDIVHQIHIGDRIEEISIQ